jgi:hypothetical protein
VAPPSSSVTQPFTPQQPGWYDDPHDPTAQRYWDGRDWTPQRQRKSISAQPSLAPVTVTQPSVATHSSTAQLQPGPSQQGRWVWKPLAPQPQASPQPPLGSPGWQASAKSPRGWSALPRSVQRGVFVAALVAAVALTLGILGVVHSERANSADPGSGWAPTRTSAPPSTSDDWKASVCRLGTIRDFNGSLKNATGLAACNSPQGVPISIGQYTSSFVLENDIAFWKGFHYATITADDGATWVFLAISEGSQASAALTPLEKYGFQLQTVTR